MAPSDAAYIPANTAVKDVQTVIEGLHGQTRLVAIAAAKRLEAVSTMSGLDESLKTAASEFGRVTATLGEEVQIDVFPGRSHGGVCVVFRPPPGLRGLAHAGLDSHLRTSACLRAERCLAAEDGKPGWSYGGLLSMGREGIDGSVHLSPPQLSPPVPFMPRLSWTKRQVSACKLPLCALSTFPDQQMQQLTFSLVDAGEKHNFFLDGVVRDLIPDGNSSDAVWRGPLRSMKTSVAYQFTSEEPRVRGSANLRHFSAELSGPPGDVSIARARFASCAKWPFSPLGWPLPIGTLSWYNTLGLAMPLLSPKGWVPLEDKFHLGGADGILSERLPGFCSRSLGRLERRKPAGLAGHSYDQLGGDALLASTASLELPLLSLAGLELRGVVFGALGAVVDRVTPKLLQDFYSQARGSAGFGIGAPLPGGGLIGMSWAKPLWNQPSDRLQNLQFYVSFNSLA